VLSVSGRHTNAARKAGPITFAAKTEIRYKIMIL
jgi:hypothetical protein